MRPQRGRFWPGSEGPAYTPTKRSRVRATAVGLVYLGVFLLGFVAHQLVLTGFLASRAQGQLEADLATRSVQLVKVMPLGDEGLLDEPTEAAVSFELETLPGDDLKIPIIDPPNGTVLLTEPTPERGGALGRIRIPVIEVAWTAVEGVGRDQLRSGPGHMATTPLPGQPGNAVISGHRTTYGAPFRDLDQLEPGSLIHWDSPVVGTTTYMVTEIFVVGPDDVWVTEPRPGAWLTLTTCNPLFSARERLIVVAKLVTGPNLAAIGTTS